MTLNIKGQLFSLARPQVMAILNVTPDSFYPESRKQTEEAITTYIEKVLREGAGMIDVGGYSSRPNAPVVDPVEEMRRLSMALDILNRHFPEVPVSVDTFRASVAEKSVEYYGASIINDISGGELDKTMFETVARLKVPYILMHMRGNPKTMQQQTDYSDMMEEIMLYFARKVEQLHLLGVSDIILDPGFGFSKTLDQNYQLMKHLVEFREFNLPLLVGISRKSMIYKFLETTPEESLNGTTVLNTFALMNGANILRVHDVKAAVEAVRMVDKITSADN